MTTSSNYRIRDPEKIMERRQRIAHLKRAKAISKLPEEQWAKLVQAESKDSQEEIWVFLRAIRTARSL